MIKAAPALMDNIMPYVNAMAQYHVQKEEGLQKADKIIADRDESDINVQQAYILKGNHALKNHNYGEAQDMFSKANSIDPKSAIAYNNIGVALTAMANQENLERENAKVHEAISQYKNAIAANHRYAVPYNNLGLLQMRINSVNDAIANYHIAIQVAPKYMFAHWNLAYAFQKQGSFDDALNEYRIAIRYATDDNQRATLHTKIADLFREKPGENDHLKKAIAEYRRAIEINDYSWAHHNLGLVWREQGKIDDAIAEFRNAADLEGNNETFKESLRQAREAKDEGAM
jgi:tetratricopeptide (TPR) repeat protein